MPLAAGSALGPYLILAPIGAGGMGEVYRARDTRLGRDVAIKVLPERLARQPAYVQRFEREARAVAALSHPAILAIFDFGRAGDHVYAVTELLEGETLRQRLNRGALEWREAVELAAELAGGVGAAHLKGITHRDLKPENVFLTTAGAVKVLDFGLARVEPAFAPDAQTDANLHTEAGTVLGTIGYMSPEQVRGEPVTPASDVFALGCVLYEMLTGRKAFVRATPAESLAAILTAEPEPPGTAHPAPGPLAGVIRRCLDKKAQHRYPTARELEQALLDLLQHAKSTPSAIDSLAVIPFTSLGGSDAEYLGDGIAENLINRFSRIPTLRVIPRGTVFRYKGRESEPRQIARELEVRLLLTGRVVERGGRLSVQVELVDAVEDKQVWGERFHRPITDIFAVEEEIAGRIAGQLRTQLGQEECKGLAQPCTCDGEAYRLYLQGRHHLSKRAPDNLWKGIEYFEQAVARDPAFALAHAGIAESYCVLAFLSVMPGKEAGRRAVVAARKATEMAPRLPQVRAVMASAAALSGGNWNAANAEIRAAVELLPGSAETHDWFSMICCAQGRFDEAIREVRRALELDPLSLVIHHHAVWIYLHARRLEEALDMGLRALELEPAYVPTVLWTSLVYSLLGRHGEALALVERQDSLLRRPFQPFSAHVYAAAGRTADVRRILAEAIELSRGEYVEPYFIALAHAALGDAEAAFEWLEKSYDDGSVYLLYWFRNDPRLDSLRPDPRYDRLLARVGLGDRA